MARWSIPLEELAKKNTQKLDAVVRAATITVFSRIVQRSPVDTGRFRANWNVSFNAIDNNISATVDPGGQRKLAEVKDVVLSMPVGGVAYMCNSLPYALTLEYGLYPNPPKKGSKKRGEDVATVHVTGGYSMQAPAGMVRISVREFANAVQDAVKGSL